MQISGLLLLAALAAPDDLRRVIDEAATRTMRANHIPGAAVIVVRGREIVYSRGFGVADVNKGIPVDPATTAFRIGSVTKLFTATAVMQLAAEGRIRPEDDVNRYTHAFRVPDAFGRPITIATLLTHTAGFDEKLARTAVRSREDVLPLAEYLRRELPDRVLPPGRLVQYSNHGYVLLGHVVESVSGMPFGAYLQSHLFQPMGMTRTVYGLPDGVHGYEYRGGEVREIPRAYLQIGPAADITATAEDMGRFMSAQLTDGSLALMHQQHFTHHPALPGLTYGFWESRYNDVYSLYHLGGVRGFASLLCLYPQEQLGIFVVNNGDDQTLGFAVVDAWLAHSHKGMPFTATAAAHAQPLDLGAYRWLRHGRNTIEKLAVLRRGEAPATIGGDGRLRLGERTFLPRGGGLFGREGSYERAALVEGGRYAVIDTDVLERVAWYERSSLHQLLLLGLVAAFVSAFVPSHTRALTLREAPQRTAMPRLARWISAVNLLFVIGMIVIMMTIGRGDIWFGYPRALYALLALPIASALATPLLLWRTRGVRMAVIAIAQVGFGAFCWYWNLLGYHL